VLLMHLSGRIAGISGIVGGLLPPGLADDWRLRLAFVAGLLLTPLILNAIAGFNGIGAPTVGFALLIPAGLLIGVGSTLGKRMHIRSRHLWTREAVAALGSGDRNIHGCGGRNRVRYAACDLRRGST
jgi:hypothetical protein